MFDNLEIEQLVTRHAQSTPQELLGAALEQFPNIAISFSGAEDVVLIDMAVRIRKDVSVFSLDTGRLHPETYRFLEEVRSHYGIELELLSPDSLELSRLVHRKGLFSFYREGHKECCAIRKVAPLRKKLAMLDAWVTGLRHDQTPVRSAVPLVQEDEAFSGPEHTLIKFNPLANWTSAQVWAYIREEVVPYNELHRQGYISIGCEPCTRPVLPNEHERAGRWWWEDEAMKDCGLHVGADRKVDGSKVGVA
jgi:phosphoadenosine phosphosulfate reductase